MQQGSVFFANFVAFLFFFSTGTPQHSIPSCIAPIHLRGPINTTGKSDICWYSAGDEWEARLMIYCLLLL
jgi:hypothetical protein